MPTSIDVENQHFAFGDAWRLAFKYDDSALYRRGPERLKGELEGHSQATRAVDVVALHQAEGLLLLEAKDCRGHEIANRTRIRSGGIALEVALKVRDTVAGLLGAARNEPANTMLLEVFNALRQGQQLTVVLWLEDDAQRDPLMVKPQLQALNAVLKKHLAWLNVKSLVLSSRVANRLRDLHVSNLPGAGQT